MIGQAKWLYSFLEGTKKRFDIPVYQRNYNWKRENCIKLYDDLVAIHKKEKRSHFLGSIVSANNDDRHFTIIDGQQRITTVSLIMIAMINAVKKGKFTEEKDQKTADYIRNTYIVAEDDEVNKLRLRPYNNDKEAFSNLVFDTEDKYKNDSNVTVNYRYFYERIVNRRELTLQQLSDAIEKLQIISIELDIERDDPQLIFESLNSTGLALEESDKIRNFILMGQKPSMQEKLYRDYWYQIERLSKECGKNGLDEFIFNYLMLYYGKVKITEIYNQFKEYAKGKESEDVLNDMLHYAKIFNKLRKHDLGSIKANAIKERLDRLRMTVMDIFLMSYYDKYLNDNDPESELIKVLTVLESFLFRRIVCDEPSYELRSLFASLHRRVLALKGEQIASYSDVLVYLLENIKENYPKDEFFASSFGERDIYHLKPHIRAYIFDCLERSAGAETINVYERLQKINLSPSEKPFSVEHIMPQTLTSAWVNDLGCTQAEAQELHGKWLHTIANLTVTAYNSALSNLPFAQKKEMVYSTGGLILNEYIRQQSVWTEKQMKERRDKLVEKSLDIWKYPESAFKSQSKPMVHVTLDDEDYDFTYKNLKEVIFYGKSYQHKYGEWTSSVLWLYQQLFDLDPQPLFDLADDPNEAYFVRIDDKNNRKIDDGLYVFLNTDTNTKIKVLRRVVDRYPLNEGEVNDDIVFVINNDNNDS